jgi:hypothetical protein
VSFAKYNWNNYVKEDKMGSACSTNRGRRRRKRRRRRNFVKNLSHRYGNDDKEL